MKNKLFLGVVIALAAVLIFENAYLLGKHSRENPARLMQRPYQQPMILEREQEMPQPVLYNWDPFAEVNRMQQRINRIFNDNFFTMPDMSSVSTNKIYTGTGISFNNEANVYLVKVRVPGVKKEDIDIQVKDRQLIITAGSSKDKTNKGKEGYSREYSYGNYLSTFLLPKDSLINNITSNYKDGVLTINIPKIEVQKERKPVALKVSVR